MTLEELRKRLKEAAESYDTVCSHNRQDALLLEYINDPEVTDIFNSSEKWYE